jgi:tetratricopeptide (TPR) repeat protein
MKSLFLCLLLGYCSAAESTTTPLENYLNEGNFRDGILHYSEKTHKTSADVFALGTLQFISSLEELIQGFYHYGLKSRIAREIGVPFLRLPVPKNQNPAQVRADDVYKLLNRFHQAMAEANRTLAQIKDEPFKQPLDLKEIRLDFDNDGQYKKHERLFLIYAVYNRRASTDESPFRVTFDLADAYWLKGYTHVLMGLLDMALAYDGTRLFDYTAHLFFEKPVSSSHLLSMDQYAYYTDVIAAIHLLDLPLAAPERLTRARTHWKGMIQASRDSWKFIQAEEDDEQEWLPNPQQKSSATGIQLTAEMIKGWQHFLNEFDALLDGQKLIPHWRVMDGRAINLKKVFETPSRFDLVLWVHGSAAIPYLEQGERTTPDTWNNLERIFRGNFVGFALWIN